MIDECRFISDVMLGGLTKWLRLMGFDTLYFRAIDDSELVRIAKQQQRVILTRDTALSKTGKTNQVILIHSNYTIEQVKEVLLYLRKKNLTHLQSSPRCTNCNGKLIIAHKQSALNNVPDYILLNQNSFLKCEDCGKVFWHGSHKKKIDKTLDDVLKMTERHNTDSHY